MYDEYALSRVCAVLPVTQDLEAASGGNVDSGYHLMICPCYTTGSSSMQHCFFRAGSCELMVGIAILQREQAHQTSWTRMKSDLPLHELVVEVSVEALRWRHRSIHLLRSWGRTRYSVSWSAAVGSESLLEHPPAPAQCRVLAMERFLTERELGAQLPVPDGAGHAHVGRSQYFRSSVAGREEGDWHLL